MVHLLRTIIACNVMHPSKYSDASTGIVCDRAVYKSAECAPRRWLFKIYSCNVATYTRNSVFCSRSLNYGRYTRRYCCFCHIIRNKDPR